MISAGSGVVTALSLVDTSVGPLGVLSVVALHVVIGLSMWLLARSGWIEHRQGALAPVVVTGFAMLTALGLTAWVSKGYASGTGPLVVLVFAWFGLHASVRVLWAAVPWATVTYVVGLALGDARPRVLWSTAVLIPIATTVAVFIAGRVERQRQLHEQLEIRERWRGALMATLAHDVRSPLTTVTGTLELLEDEPEMPERYRSLVAAAIRQTQRVLRLAVGILEVERVEHGALVLDRAEVRVADVATEVAALTRPDAVRVEIAPDVVVSADAARLEQVLFNLTNNALRHGRPPVVMSAARVDGRVELAVEDHGSGVPDADVPFLFDRFSSADHSPGSVGLGLWIVRTLVEVHDGEVRYEAPRGGARFVISLPAGDGVPVG